MNRAIALSLVLGLLAPAATAQVLRMPPTAQPVSERVSVLDRFALPVGPWTADGLPVELFEGRVERRSWRIPGASLTTLQAAEPLRDALVEAGFEVLLDCTARICGGYDFRFAVNVVPAPDMFVDMRDFMAISAVRGDEAVALLVSRGQSDVWIQETHVVPVAEVIVPVAPPPAVVAPPVAPPPEVGDFEGQLARLGYATLTDLDFATGSTALGDRTYGSVETIARMMDERPDLRIALVGHTDLTGSLDVNISVSERRANAVRSRLIDSYGITPDRIEARGIGYLAPRASVLTPEGQEANRRVEVILLNP